MENKGHERMSSDLNLECLDVIGNKMRLECSIQFHQIQTWKSHYCWHAHGSKRHFIFQYQLESIYKGDGKIRNSAQMVETNQSRREVLSIVL